MLYDYAAKGSHVSMAQPEMIDMVSHPKIELTTEDTVVYEVIFDPETFYCKLIRSRSDVQGRMSVVESVFSDFRTIDGIVFATSVETRIDGMTALRIHFDEIKLNEDIDDSLFDKPHHCLIIIAVEVARPLLSRLTTRWSQATRLRSS